MTDTPTPNASDAGAGAPRWQAPTAKEHLDLLLLGDTAFGASYQEALAAKGKGNVLKEHGYDHGFEHVDHILKEADLVVANLETPLTNRRDSPFKDIRPYIHYDDPDLTLSHLLKHNITAVTLANNHTHDMGEPGLLDTIEALDRHGVLAIGAGRTLPEATRPLQIRAELTEGTPFSASVFTRFRGGRQFRDVLKAYATEDRPGSAPFKSAETARAIESLKTESPDEFVIVTPHWRRDYGWTSDAQRDAARNLIDAGANLIVGHGSHMAQEIDFYNGRLVLNGIGNFLFNSLGRYKKMGVPPYSMVVRLTADASNVIVRVYPIHTDNRVTNFQPKPVTKDQFDDFYHTMLTRTNDTQTFLTVAAPNEDGHGYHLAFNLDRDGRISQRDNGDEGEVPAPWDADDGTFVFHRSMNTGSLLLERELRKLGGSSERLDSSFFIGSLNGEVFSFESTSSSRDSVPAVRATQQKDIARALLERANVHVAQGRAFSRSEKSAALDYARSNMPVVVKPAKGNKGTGVTVDIRDDAAFARAWESALRATTGRVLVEKHFTGVEGRFLVVDGNCLAVTQRIPPHVVGDGVHSIRELIEAKNKQRYKLPHLHNRLITLDSGRLDRMREHELSPLSILDAGQHFVLDYKGGLSTGAENIDITDEVHRTYLEIAEAAARAFPGLRLAGVDIMAHGFTAPPDEQNYIVCEVNNQPGIGSHHFPSSGRARNIAGAVIRSVAEPAKQWQDDPGSGQQEAQAAAKYDSDAHLLAGALTARGLDVTWYSRSFLIARGTDTTVTVHGATTGRTGHAAIFATRRPAIATALLERAGVPLPRQEIFTTRQHRRASNFARRRGRAVVRTGDRRGVPVTGTDREAFRSAWDDSRPRGRRGILIQERVPGTELDFLVSYGHVLAIMERTPNGEAKDVTRKAHRSYRDAAARAALAFPGLDLCEVTLIAEAPNRAATEDNHHIVLVRSNPELARYTTPDHGPGQEVASAIVEHHLNPPDLPRLRDPRPARQTPPLVRRAARKGIKLARQVRRGSDRTGN